MQKKYVFGIIFLLYILATFVQFNYSLENTVEGIYFGLPIMQTGDEPHYYITLYSMVNDKDIFLTNNYNNAIYNNGSDRGTKQLSSYDRHTRLFDSINKEIIDIPFKDNFTIDLSVIPDENSFIKEIPGHPIGLSLFVFLLLWPLKNTSFLEHAAIFVTLIFSLAGLYVFYKIMIFYHADENKALLFTFVLACATQWWYYAKTFWAEPYIASFLIVSWYFIFVKETKWGYALSGFLLGFCFLMKYPVALLIFPLILFLLYDAVKMKKIIPLLVLCIPLLFCGGIALTLNMYLTGSILQFNQADAVHFVNPTGAMLRWLFNPTFGLLIYSPILLFSICGVKSLWKKEKIHAAVLFAILLLYFLFWTSYIVSQYGGGGYSARYLVPLIPLIVMAVSFSNAEIHKNKCVQYGFYILFFISCAINFLAAFAYPAFTGYPLVVSITKILHFMF